MCKRLRSVLVCLLMLALPMQALAAFDMQLGQQVHASAALQAMPAHHGQHAVLPDAGANPDSHHPANAASCSLCAFCVSAALIAQPIVHAGTPYRATLPAGLSERLVSVVLDAPERPPRLSIV